jgi:hypothetical protein
VLFFAFDGLGMALNLQRLVKMELLTFGAKPEKAHKLQKATRLSLL